MLYGVCYPHPRSLAPDQLLRAPCQCSCEDYAPGPPTPLDHDTEEEVVGFYATQAIIAMSTGTSFAMGLDDESDPPTLPSEEDPDRPAEGHELPSSEPHQEHELALAHMDPDMTVVEVECNCHCDIRGGTRCTVRRHVDLRYLNEDERNAMLCPTCYRYPHEMGLDQLRRTHPCQCDCEVCASGASAVQTTDQGTTQAAVSAGPRKRRHRTPEPGPARLTAPQVYTHKTSP